VLWCSPVVLMKTRRKKDPTAVAIVSSLNTAAISCGRGSSGGSGRGSGREGQWQGQLQERLTSLAQAGRWPSLAGADAWQNGRGRRAGELPAHLEQPDAPEVDEEELQPEHEEPHGGGEAHHPVHLQQREAARGTGAGANRCGRQAAAQLWMEVA
jgi:hypothetical protein